jgi:hypothetical protein
MENNMIAELENITEILFNNGYNSWGNTIRKAIVLLEKRKGTWKDNGNGTISCSECGTWFPKEREPYLCFCGWCGARMHD